LLKLLQDLAQSCWVCLHTFALLGLALERQELTALGHLAISLFFYSPQHLA